MGSWSLYECLDGQLAIEDATYLLNSGRYSSVATDYVEALNERLRIIVPSRVALPDSQLSNGEDISEGDYNVLAANSSGNYLLMDKHNVITARKTSPIEVCDLLTMDRQLVHVKRKFSSATLSHLFSQGETSGRLLVDSSEFRAAVRAKIPATSVQFRQLFDEGRFRAGDFEIVYGIIADWGGGGLADRLPFFSKVNLWHRAQQLRRIGYNVTYAAIQIAQGAPGSAGSP